MSVQLAGGILALYFGLLLAISYFTSRGADTHAFFTANRESPWWIGPPEEESEIHPYLPLHPRRPSYSPRP